MLCYVMLCYVDQNHHHKNLEQNDKKLKIIM